jgi:hypothetical protein
MMHIIHPRLLSRDRGPVIRTIIMLRRRLLSVAIPPSMARMIRPMYRLWCRRHRLRRQIIRRRRRISSQHISRRLMRRRYLFLLRHPIGLVGGAR